MSITPSRARASAMRPDRARTGISGCSNGRANALIDEVAAIADESTPSDLQESDASAWVQQQGLRVDANKWLACKLLPPRRRGRMELNVDAAHWNSGTSALEAAQRRVDVAEAEPQWASLMVDSRTRA